MIVDLFRFKYNDDRTIGEMIAEGERLGYTLEDTVRGDNIKIPKKTAIMSGSYRIDVTFSNRFQRDMIILYGVPMFKGIRVHGGNTEEDTEGCILLGEELTSTGIRNCADVNKKLIELVIENTEKGETSWIKIHNTPQVS